VRAQTAVQQAAGDANDVRDPVVKVCTSIEAGLYELNDLAKGSCSN